MTPSVARAALTLALRGWVPLPVVNGQARFRVPAGDADTPEAVAALAVLRDHREEAVRLLARPEPLTVAARILRAEATGGDLAAAVTALSTMSRDGRLQVLRLLTAALPERTGRATTTGPERRRAGELL